MVKEKMANSNPAHLLISTQVAICTQCWCECLFREVRKAILPAKCDIIVLEFLIFLTLNYNSEFGINSFTNQNNGR